MILEFKKETMEFIIEIFEKITHTHMFFLVSVLALYVALVAIKNKK